MRGFDELNILRSEIEDIGMRNRIRNFFEKMELKTAEKEKRIELAYIFYTEIMPFLLSMDKFLKSVRTTNESGVEFEYTSNDLADFTDKAVSLYRDVLNRSGVPDDINAEMDEHIRKIASEIVTSTFSKPDNERNASVDRGFVIAVNESNATKNTQQFLEAVMKGYTKKKWVTMKDERVRVHHSAIDEEVIGIYDLFTVGNSQLSYPLDDKHGADPEEIVNCRCVVEYLP